MSARLVLIVAMMAGLQIASSACSAQSQSLFGSSGPRAQSGSTGARSAQSRGSQASTSTRAGGQASGQTGGQLSGRTGASTGAAQGPQLNQMGSLSANAAGFGTDFVGANTEGAFVGNRLAGQQSLAGAQPSFVQPGAGGRSTLNQFNQNQGRNQGGLPGAQQSSTEKVRPRYRVAFQFTPAETVQVQQRIDRQLARLVSETPALKEVAVVVHENGVAVLQGESPSAETSQLVENLVRLEPGVRAVENRLAIAAAAP